MDDRSKEIIKTIYAYLRIVFGAAIYAAGIQWLYKPVGMVSGGVTGIAMIANMLVPRVQVGTFIIIANVPIFIIALKKFGFRFMMSSIVGMIAASLFIDLFAAVGRVGVTDDPVLAAVFGGFVTGVGMGVIFSGEGTSGGVDVIATIIRQKRPYINMGTFVLVLDAVVVAAYALIFKRYHMAMYTIVAVFISSKVIDTVLYGISQSKLCHIISEYSDEIKTEIVKTLHRGVTLLDGKGAFSGQDKQVLLCVVKRQQIVQIRRIIKGIDQKAFVIISDTRNVFGEGFGSLASDKKIGD